MSDVERQETVFDLLKPAPVQYFSREVIKSRPAGLNFERRLRLLQNLAKQLFFCNLTESDLRSDSPVV